MFRVEFEQAGHVTGSVDLSATRAPEVQIKLSPEERHKFLIKYADRELDVAMINVFTLSFSPGLFASLAWRHFDQAADGCAFVQSLIDRSFSLEYLND